MVRCPPPAAGRAILRTRVDPVYRNRESGPSHAPDEGTESDLYETDILAWSEEQAARLRRVAAAD